MLVFKYDHVFVNSEASEERVSDVLKKLLFFTILMVTVPISSYFLSKSYVFEGKNYLLCQHVALMPLT